MSSEKTNAAIPTCMTSHVLVKICRFVLSIRLTDRGGMFFIRRTYMYLLALI